MKNRILTKLDLATTRRQVQMSVETKPQEIYASLRIYHENLSPDKISVDLELSPSRSWVKGEKVDGERIATTGGWLLSSREHVNSAEINKHLDWLLLMLSGCGSRLTKLQKQGFKTELVITWFSDSWNTCPALTPDFMQRIAALNMPLSFDVYLDS